MAQTSTPQAEDNKKLEDIVVTARKRTESIDTVPLAITAMTSDKIEERNLKSIEDVAAFSPGFFTQSQTGTGAGRNDRSFRQLTFRGIGASSTNVGVLAGGVAFLDGTPVLNSSLANVQDLERVEVLRGPQSVYFGRSTFIGAVNYITKDPTDHWTGRLTTEYAEGNLSDTSASISGPIVSDAISFRLSGRHYTKDGQYTTANSNVRLGDQSTNSIALTLLFTPLEGLRMRTFYNHFEDADGAPAQYTLGGKTIGAGASNCNLGGPAGPYFCGQVPQTADPALISANVTITQALYQDLLVNRTGKPIPFQYSDYLDNFGLKRKADQFSNKIDYDFGDGGPTLTAVTAYHEEKIVTMADLAFRATALNYTTSVGYRDYDWSQELRLVSSPNHRFRWVVGGNYVKLHNTTSGIIGQFGAFGVLNFGNAAVGYTQAETPSAFAGLYYDLLPKLTLTVEGRYQADKLPGHYATSATAYVDPSKTFNSFSPRVSLDYKLSPTSTVYALVSRGYKPGGFNNAILTQPAFVLAQLASKNASAIYDQERLDNYEIGIKGSFLDGRLRMSLDGYIGKYRDAQIPLPVTFYTTQNADGSPNTSGPTNTATLTLNAGKVDLKGVEFEAEAILVPGLRVGATFAYTGSKIINYACGECLSIIAQNATNNVQLTSAVGKRLAGSPEFAYTLSSNYETKVGNGLTAYVGGDYLYRGSYYAEAANIASSGASKIFNARLGVRKDSYSLELFARNLFNNQSPEQYAAWHVPEGCTRIEQCLLGAPNDDRGPLRIVVFHGARQRVMRSSQHLWDSGGHFDVDMYSHDADATYARLQRHGWTAFHDSADYGFGELQVREVIVIGPDSFVIGLIERRAPPLDWPEGLGAMTRQFNSSQVVRDYDASAAFYRDILGWKPLFEVAAAGEGEPSQILGLPMPQAAGVERRVGIWHPEGTNDGSVELIQCAGIRARDFADHAVAPNIGILSLRFPVADARALAARIERRGWPLYTPPMRLEIAPYGPVTIFAVRTPDGAILEFYETDD